MPLDPVTLFIVAVACVGLFVFWRVVVPHCLYAALPSLAETPTDPADSERQSDLLLRRLLSGDEYEQLAGLGWLDVRSPSRPQRLYRIPRKKGLVKVFEGDRLLMALCVQPTKWLPSGDLVAMHKGSIEANEEEYLRVAVRHYAYGSSSPFAREEAGFAVRQVGDLGGGGKPIVGERRLMEARQ